MGSIAAKIAESVLDQEWVPIVGQPAISPYDPKTRRTLALSGVCSVCRRQRRFMSWQTRPARVTTLNFLTVIVFAALRAISAPAMRIRLQRCTFRSVVRHSAQARQQGNRFSELCGVRRTHPLQKATNSADPHLVDHPIIALGQGRPVQSVRAPVTGIGPSFEQSTIDEAADRGAHVAALQTQEPGDLGHGTSRPFCHGAEYFDLRIRNAGEAGLPLPEATQGPHQRTRSLRQELDIIVDHAWGFGHDNSVQAMVYL